MGLFQTVEQEAFRAGINPRTKQSRDWFRKKVQRMRVNRRSLMREDEIQMTSSAIPGSMAMYFYDAKNKDTLPYWDSFPLVIIVGPAEKGFYGLNLHYLPIPLRAKFLDGLMDITTDKRYNENTKFNVKYSYLNRAAKMKYFKPCFKHYLTSQVEGQFAVVPAPEWEIATFLPTAQWNGNKSQVYKDSRNKINA
ncbi:MAG TPA: hypothetical protein D7I04_02285 [Candidatus Poseidoniales archaeon]|nr:MAG TPA: hypothetical protein D7I04_02285 [Candidatus Poseidoniales archaeon]